MVRICKNHGTCCKEWGVPALIIGFIFLFSMIFPEKFGFIIALLLTPIGMLVVGTCVTTATGMILRRKMQVASWESDRPFNDDDDDTPDPYLFNPGPGATWGLRAFMPAVQSYSFAKTPISWLTKQAKRKVAILLDDGTVSFPWFPVSWISEAAGGGTRIEVPEGWKISAKQAEVLQKKRDEIKNIIPRMRSEYQTDFLLFTDLIFAKKAKIGRESSSAGIDKVALLTDRLNRIESLQEENRHIVLRDLNKIYSDLKNFPVLSERIRKLEEGSQYYSPTPAVGELVIPQSETDSELSLSTRDLARSVDRLSSTMQHHRRAIIDSENACNCKASKTIKPAKKK